MGNDTEERTRQTALTYTIRQHDKQFLNRNRPLESALTCGEW